MLNALAQHPLEQIFHTLAMLGIDLRPEEFQRIVLVKQGATKLADVLEQLRNALNGAGYYDSEEITRDLPADDPALRRISSEWRFLLTR